MMESKTKAGTAETTQEQQQEGAGAAPPSTETTTTTQAVGGADPAGFDDAIAKVDALLLEIRETLIPLAEYLQAKDELVAEGEAHTTAEITASAINALQSRDDQIARLENELTVAKDELAKAQAVAKGKGATQKPVKARPLEVSAKVDAEQFGAATHVLFGSEAGEVINGLPALPMRSEQFSEQGDDRVLDADIEFPVHGQATRVASVALADEKGKIVSVCELVQPMDVSGGRTVRIPAGSILFRAPVAEKQAKA